MKKQMKTLLIIMMIIIINILGISTVNAASDDITTTLNLNSQTVKPGDNVEVTVRIGSFKNVTKGVNVFEAVLEYDENILSLDEENGFEALNKWDSPTYNAENKKLLTAKSSFVTSDENIMKIIFTVKEDATLGNTTIKIKDVFASDDETIYNGTVGTTTVTISEEGDVPNPPAGDENPPVEEQNPSDANNQQTSSGDSTQQTDKDDTVVKDELPKAGIQYGVLIISVVVLSVSGYVFYKKYKNAI